MRSKQFFECIGSNFSNGITKVARQMLNCLRFISMHTYIHNSSLANPSVKIIDLVSHTTHVVCVNFIHKWGDLQLKTDFERQIFWETFHGNFIYSRVFAIYLHTYIHNWPLQPFRQDYGLVSHTTHVVCVNFTREWRDLQFNVVSERQIFEKLFHGRFIYSRSFCQISAERKSPMKYFSYFVLEQC